MHDFPGREVLVHVGTEERMEGIALRQLPPSLDGAGDRARPVQQHARARPVQQHAAPAGMPALSGRTGFFDSTVAIPSTSRPILRAHSAKAIL